jgi:hypothetical protein
MVIDALFLLGYLLVADLIQPVPDMLFMPLNITVCAEVDGWQLNVFFVVNRWVIGDMILCQMK